MARDVFISYRTEDKVWADRLCEALEQQNLTCWIAPRDIAAGREWAEAIVHGLQRCKAFVILVSSHSINAKQVSREAELADHQGLPIYTFRVENVDPPPSLIYFLGNLQWLDAFDDKFDSAVNRLVAILRGGVSESSAALPIPSVPQRQPPPPVRASEKPAVAPGNAVSPRNIGIGAAVLAVLALGIWLLTSRTPAATPAEAQAETEKFLNALKSSDYQTAWNQYTADNRAAHSFDRSQKNWSEANAKFGALESYQVTGCKQDQAGTVFTCQSKLIYGDGLKAEGKYIVARNSDGSLGISESSHTEPKKTK
jgi:hypothetical protein